MRLINHSLLSQNTGLSEQLVLEIKGDLNEFQEILNAFKKTPRTKNAGGGLNYLMGM